MPYWVYGHDAKNAQRRDPLFIETDDEADARRQAEEIGMVVEEIELVKPAAPAGEKPKPTLDVSRFHGFRPNVEMILTTTATIEGCPIKRYMGMSVELQLFARMPLRSSARHLPYLNKKCSGLVIRHWRNLKQRHWP
jgi:hypothetical protein